MKNINVAEICLRFSRMCGRSLLLLHVFALVAVLNPALAIQQNAAEISFAKTHFQHVSIVPERYISLERELDIREDEPHELQERWDIVMPPSMHGSVLYLPALPKNAITYESIAAFFMGEGGKVDVAKIGHEYHELSDDFGKIMRIDFPYVELPNVAHRNRLNVIFRAKLKALDGTEEHFLRMVMPKDIVVEKASLAIRLNSNQTHNLIIDASGFEEKMADQSTNGVLRSFNLKHSWHPHQDSSDSPAPRISVATKSWSEIARIHGLFYRQELIKNVNEDIAIEDGATNSLGKTEGLDVRSTAYRLFNQVGKYLKYQPGPLDFDLESKYLPQQLGVLKQTRTGNCTDFVLLYLQLLKQFGINAEPVEVKIATNFGPIPIPAIVPRSLAFNHVIVYIPELDEYIDPTMSVEGDNPASGFALASHLFSNTLGLHLFSERLLVIKPELPEYEVNISSKIFFRDGAWMGHTTWLGRGAGFRRMVLINSSRKKRLEHGSGYDFPFQQSGFSEIPGTWVLNRDDLFGKGEIDFSYVLKNSPVDAAGVLRFVPKNVMTSAILPMEVKSLMLSAETCFGSATSTEEIEVAGVLDAKVDGNLSDISKLGVNSQFGQTIRLRDGQLKIKRIFHLNEMRALCSESEVTRQKQFYRSIESVVEATRVTVEE